MMLEDADRCLQINFCEFIVKSNQGFQGFPPSVNGGRSVAVTLNQGGSVSFCRLGAKAVLHDRKPRFYSCSRSAATGGGVLSFVHMHVQGGLMKTVELPEVKIVLQSLCLRREVIEQSAY